MAPAPDGIIGSNLLHGAESASAARACENLKKKMVDLEEQLAIIADAGEYTWGQAWQDAVAAAETLALEVESALDDGAADSQFIFLYRKFVKLISLDPDESTSLKTIADQITLYQNNAGAFTDAAVQAVGDVDAINDLISRLTVAGGELALQVDYANSYITSITQIENLHAQTGPLGTARAVRQLLQTESAAIIAIKDGDSLTNYETSFDTWTTKTQLKFLAELDEITANEMTDQINVVSNLVNEELQALSFQNSKREIRDNHLKVVDINKQNMLTAMMTSGIACFKDATSQADMTNILRSEVGIVISDVMVTNMLLAYSTIAANKNTTDKLDDMINLCNIVYNDIKIAYEYDQPQIEALMKPLVDLLMNTASATSEVEATVLTSIAAPI